MSSNQLDQAFILKIKSSLSKQLLIVLPHIVIVFILLIFIDFKGVTTIYLIGALVCIVLSLNYFIRLHLRLSSKRSISKIHKSANDQWALTRKNDDKIVNNVVISTSSFSSNLLIILIFLDSSYKEYVVLITPDSVNKDDFRKLKVLIKTKRLGI